MLDDEDIDEEDYYEDEEGSRLDHHLKEHSSIIGKIVLLVVCLFLITWVIDPMTPNIEESEIIYSIGGYPYNKVMDLFREHPTDSDDDGLADSEEIDGWELESRVLSLKTGDTAIYNFSLEHPGNYLINLSFLAPEDTGIGWGWGVLQRSSSLQASDWKTASLQTNYTSLAIGNYSLHMEVTSGNLTIDWISLVAPENEYAVALDGGDAYLTNGTITNMMVHVTTDPHNPDTDYDGMLDGYEVATGIRIGGWQDPMVTNNRFAFLLAGGSTKPADNYPSIKNNVEYAYEVLHDFYGYTSHNIKVLSWDGKIQTMNIVDAPGTLPEINNAFKELGNEMGPNDFLFVYITSHGVPGKVEVYNTPKKHDMFRYTWLMDNLTSIHEQTGVKRIAVVVDACYSGSVIFDVKGDYIITIASSKADDESYASKDVHSLFTHYFYEALEHPNLASLPSYEKVKNVEFTFEEHRFISLGEAFTISKDKLRVQKISGREQIPQIDQDGDGLSDEKEEGLAYNTYI
ncbi:MAG: caspase family protein [Thermoplasmata archaeon]|nr:caspase family protein [Thermoplasmata archaeon]